MKLLDWIQDLKVQTVPTEPEDPLTPALANRLSELNGIRVVNVMTPRSVMMALDADVQLRRVRRLKSSKAAYFPVYKGDLDHILGWIAKKRVLELLNEPSEEVHLAQHLRPAGEIGEDATAAELPDAFLKAASPFLVVKNSQGSTSGIVQLTDFVELLFGFELGAQVHSPPAEYAPPLLRSYEL